MFSVYTWAVKPNAIYLSTPLHFALPYTQFTVNTNTCILFDYRGFGENSACAINPKFLYYNEFSIDWVCIIEWAKEQFEGQGIGIYAFSMGSVAATLALAQQSVDFLIAEGFVVNPTKVQQRLRDVSGKEVLLPICSQNYDLALQKLSLPILLFAGTLDPITTLEDSELFAKKQANRTVIAFKGKHGTGFLTLSATNYTSKIAVFLQKIGNKVVTPP